MNLPQKISGFRATVINRIIDCLFSLSINESEDIAVTTSKNGTTLTLKNRKNIFRPLLQVPTDNNSRALYMVPCLREWKKSDENENEIVPIGEETFYDDEVEEADKNQLFLTWDFVRAHDDVAVTPEPEP